MSKEDLFILQEKYLLSRTEESLDELSKELYILSGKLLTQYRRRKGFKLSAFKQDDTIQYAVSNLIKQYITREDFKVELSFAGYIHSALYYYLHNKKIIREDNELNYDYCLTENLYMSAEQEYFNTHYLDGVYDYIHRNYEAEQSIRLVNHIAKIIERKKPINSYMYLVSKKDKEPLLDVVDILHKELSNEEGL